MAQKEGTSDMATGRLCCAFVPLMIEGKWISESVEGTIKDDISLKGGLVWIDRRGRRAAPSSAIGCVASPTSPGLACRPCCDQSPENKDWRTGALLLSSPSTSTLLLHSGSLWLCSFIPSPGQRLVTS